MNTSPDWGKWDWLKSSVQFSAARREFVFFLEGVQAVMGETTVSVTETVVSEKLKNSKFFCFVSVVSFRSKIFFVSFRLFRFGQNFFLFRFGCFDETRNHVSEISINALKQKIKQSLAYRLNTQNWTILFGNRSAILCV